jgi:TatA/E family protein of Tat protein translocase
MFGLGFQEIVIIAILAILLLGPKKIPELAQMLGKVLKDFQKAADDVKREISTPVEDVKKEVSGPLGRLKSEVVQSMEKAAWEDNVKDGIPGGGLPPPYSNEAGEGEGSGKEPAAAPVEPAQVEASKEPGSCGQPGETTEKITPPDTGKLAG